MADLAVMLYNKLRGRDAYAPLHVESRLHVLNKDKFVDADPEGLAIAAGVSLDVYALASCMQSEESGLRGRVAVGWATINYCRRHKTTPSALLLRSIYRGQTQASHGHFASQEALGKWASTAKPPTARMLIIAQALLAKRMRQPDPTRGAELWDAPETQDRAHARNPSKYPKDSNAVAADRIAAGGREVWVPGVPDTRFWAFA